MKNYIYTTDIYSNQKIILIRLNELNLSYDEFYYFYIHPDNNPENYSSMFEFKTNSLIFESKDKGFNHKDNFNNIFNNYKNQVDIGEFNLYLIFELIINALTTKGKEDGSADIVFVLDTFRRGLLGQTNLEEYSRYDELMADKLFKANYNWYIIRFTRP